MAVTPALGLTMTHCYRAPAPPLILASYFLWSWLSYEVRPVVLVIVRGPGEGKKCVLGLSLRNGLKSVCSAGGQGYNVSFRGNQDQHILRLTGPKHRIYTTLFLLPALQLLFTICFQGSFLSMEGSELHSTILSDGDKCCGYFRAHVC